MKILFNLPSRQRPSKLISSIENIISLSMSASYEILVTMDVEDATVATKQFNDKLCSYENVRPVYGFSKGKIDAINKNIWMVNDWDILVSTSDDIIFTQEGFDTEIICAMQQWFPNFDGVLHYLDGNNIGVHQITMPVLGRKFYDKFKYVFHPSYDSTWCDKELLEVAKRMGKHKVVNENIYKHLHPAFNTAPNDELYKKNQITYQQDSNNYFKRLAINFDI